MPRKKKLTQEVKDCIIICKECAHSCIAAIPHSVEVEGEHLSRPHVSLLNLCSDICNIAARTLLMGVDFDESISRACASVCDATAAECESLNDDYLRRCAEICRLCARSCRQLSRTKRLAA